MSELDLLRELGDRVVPPSLDALRDTARRRDRRQGAAIAVTTAAVLAVVTAGTWALSPRDDTVPQPIGPTGPGPSSRPLTWAEGSTIHYGERTVEAEGAVVELDLTDDGVGYRTDDGRVWFTDGTQSQELGALGVPGPGYDDGAWPLTVRPSWLLSANSGSRLIWFEFPSPGEPQVVVYDTADRVEAARDPVALAAGQHAFPAVLSERFVYWYVDPESGALPQDADRVRYDPESGEQSAATQRDLYDDLNGDAAVRSLRTNGDGGLCGGGRCPDLAYTDGMGQQMGLGLRADVAGVDGIAPVGAGDMVSEDVAGRPFVFDDVPDYPTRGTGAAWLVEWEDDDTVVLLYPRQDRTDLIECDLGTHRCALAVSRPGPLVVPEYGDSGAVG